MEQHSSLVSNALVDSAAEEYSTVLLAGGGDSFFLVYRFFFFFFFWGGIVCSSNPHLRFLFLFLTLMEISSCTLLPRFKPGSVHCGSAS